MKKMMKAVTIATLAVGMIGTSAFAATADWTEVKGIFNSKIKVVIEGKGPSDITPLIVDGTAYLPVREMGNTFGLNVTWNEQESRIDIQQMKPPADVQSLDGIVLDVQEGKDGVRYVDVLNQGADAVNAIVRLVVPADFKVTDNKSETHDASVLKAGMKIEATHSLAMTKSIPPQAKAESIKIVHELGMTEGTIQSVQSTDHGLTIKVSDKADDPTAGVVLHVSKDTKLMSGVIGGEAIDPDQLKQGMKVKAYYGPVMTMSLPPQSAAQAIFVLDSNDNEAK